MAAVTSRRASCHDTDPALGGGSALAGRSEELERDAVRIAETHARSIRRVLDAAMVDAELVEPQRPPLELATVGDAEADVVETEAELAEPVLERRGGVLWSPTRVPPTRNTVWCMSGSVSSSITGSVPNSARYHGTLRVRSLTVRATWPIGGNSGICAPHSGQTLQRFTTRHLHQTAPDRPSRDFRGRVDIPTREMNAVALVLSAVWAWRPDHTVTILSPQRAGFWYQACVHPDGEWAVFWGAGIGEVSQSGGRI